VHCGGFFSDALQDGLSIKVNDGVSTGSTPAGGACYICSAGFAVPGEWYLINFIDYDLRMGESE
jgi:hypothetical protein